jgi:hypothetical protein
MAVGPQHHILAAVLILITYGLGYFGLSIWWKVPESEAIIGRLAQVVRKATD